MYELCGEISTMKKQIGYAIFGTGIYDGLVTPDKQMHVGPGVIATIIEDYWEPWAGTLQLLEEWCPEETFTLVLDDFENFDNDYWGCNKALSENEVLSESLEEPPGKRIFESLKKEGIIYLDDGVYVGLAHDGVAVQLGTKGYDEEALYRYLESNPSPQQW